MNFLIQSFSIVLKKLPLPFLIQSTIPFQGETKWGKEGRKKRFQKKNVNPINNVEFLYLKGFKTF